MVRHFKVIISTDAERDIKEILEYLDEEAGIRIAEDVRKSFTVSFERLEQMPTAYSILRELQPLTNRKIRKIVVKKAWRVIFEINESQKEVYVLRVLHFKRGPSSIEKVL